MLATILSSLNLRLTLNAQACTRLLSERLKQVIITLKELGNHFKRRATLEEQHTRDSVRLFRQMQDTLLRPEARHE